MRRIVNFALLLFLFIPAPDVNCQIGDYFIDVGGLAYTTQSQIYVEMYCEGSSLHGFFASGANNTIEMATAVIPANEPITVSVGNISYTISPAEVGYREYSFDFPKVSVLLFVSVYDVPTINSVEYENRYFTINSTKARNLPSNGILYMNYRNQGMAWEKTTAISNLAKQSIALEDLYESLKDPCGRTFEFQYSLRIYGASGEIYGNVASFREPEVGNVVIDSVYSRKACSPYLTIQTTVAPSIATDIGRYQMTLLQEDALIIGFDRQTLNGNNMTFYIDDAVTNNKITGEDIYLHVEDNNSELCWRKIQFNPGNPVVRLDITSVTPSKVGGTNYNIVRYGESTGQVQMELNLNERVAGFEIKRSDWPDFIPYEATKTGTVYTLSGLTAGNFLVRCVDTDGCYSASQSFTLTQPGPFYISDKSTADAPCHPGNTGNGTVVNTGSLSFRINGGVPSFTVKLNGSTLFTGVNGQIEIPGLSPGNYAISVDNTFQQSSFTMTVGHPSLLMTLTEDHTNIPCKGEHNGTITLKANNNANTISNFAFSSPTATTEVLSSNSRKYSSLASGVYSATVTDIKGCIARVDNIQVTEPADSLSVAATGSKIAAFGDNTGIIKLVISGGTPTYSYSLYREGVTCSTGNSTGATNITGLTAGTYSVEITDANGCTSGINNIEVIQPESPLTIGLTGTINASCHGYNDGKAVVAANGGWGGYSYQYNDDMINQSGIFTGLMATTGSDSVFVTDSEGVSTGIPVTITEPDELVVSGIKSYNLQCYGDNSGAVKLSVSGGTPVYSVSMNNNDWVEGDSIGGLPAYTDRIIYVVDSQGCATQTTFSVTEPEPLLISTTPEVVDAHCGQDDGMITSRVSGGTAPYNYHWENTGTGEEPDNNDMIAKNLGAGNYRLTVTDVNGCSSVRSTIVNDIDGPSISVGLIKDATCNGSDDGSISISLYGYGTSFNYIWKKLENSQESIISEGKTSCETEMADLDNGEYLLTVTDSKKCSTNERYTINEPEPLKITGEVIEPGCHDSYDGFIAINVTGGNGGYTYKWSDNTTGKNLEFIHAGEYSVSISDKKWCGADTVFTVDAPEPPEIVLEEIEEVMCSGNSLEIDGGKHSGYTWYLNGEVVGTGRYLTVKEQGDYILLGTDEHGCSNRDTVHVEVSDTPLASFFLLQDTALIGEAVQAIDVTWPVPDMIEWLFDPEVNKETGEYWSANFSANDPGVVNVTLRAWYNGCYSDSTKTITILDEEAESKGLLRTEKVIKSIKAYPNPTDGNFRVSIDVKERSDVTLTLYNSIGETLESRKINLDGYSEIPFNFSGLKPGIYLLMVRTGRENRQLRIIIR